GGGGGGGGGGGEALGRGGWAGAGAPAEDVLGDARAGAEIVSWIVRRVTAGLCAMQAGVCAEALRLTAAHVSEREQFGQKLATFQAVAPRAADAYIDTQAVTLTPPHAPWRLGPARPAGRSRSAPPMPTSTPRRSRSPPGRRHGGWAPVSTPTRRSTPPSSGPPRAASGSHTPRSTCTAASASTPSIRCSATSAGRA